MNSAAFCNQVALPLIAPLCGPGFQSTTCSIDRLFFPKHMALQASKVNVLSRFCFIFYLRELSPLRFIGPIFVNSAQTGFLKAFRAIQHLPRQPYLNMDPINRMLFQAGSFTIPLTPFAPC